MADQTLSEQATRRDDVTFRGQVSAALDREVLDIVRDRGAWAGLVAADAQKAAGYARALLGSTPARVEAIEMSARIAASDLVAQALPTDVQITKAVRRALRFVIGLSQEA